MTATTSTHSQPGKKSARPTVWRQFASKYVDVLICGFISWVVCFTFGWHTYWASMTLFLFFGEWFWCRDRLHPTAGEYCLGIRYLTSSSSQVVADIQVIQAKLKLNGFLLTAGIVEMTLAMLPLFSGWTFLSPSSCLRLFTGAAAVFDLLDLRRFVPFSLQFLPAQRVQTCLRVGSGHPWDSAG